MIRMDIYGKLCGTRNCYLRNSFYEFIGFLASLREPGSASGQLLPLQLRAVNGHRAPDGFPYL